MKDIKLRNPIECRHDQEIINTPSKWNDGEKAVVSDAYCTCCGIQICKITARLPGK